MAVPILTYHSMRVGGDDYHINDHIALAHDLRMLDRLGWRIMELQDLVHLHRQGCVDQLKHTVAITFDDGPNLDWYDIDNQSDGLQRGFAGILQDFKAEAERNDVCATAFVIAGPDARHELDHTCMLGLGWWTDEWWPLASAVGISIQNHSWDHNHATLSVTVQHDGLKGNFHSIETFSECDAEIRQAADYIDQRLGRAACCLLAYPYGEYSAYLADEYLPGHIASHRQIAAFTTHPVPMSDGCNRWLLPRYVCGDHWTTPEELQAILRDACSGTG